MKVRPFFIWHRERPKERGDLAVIVLIKVGTRRLPRRSRRPTCNDFFGIWEVFLCVIASDRRKRGDLAVIVFDRSGNEEIATSVETTSSRLQRNGIIVQIWQPQLLGCAKQRGLKPEAAKNLAIEDTR